VISTEWLVLDLGGVAAEFRPERRLVALERATGISADTINHRLFTSGLDDDAEIGLHGVESIASEIRDALDHRISHPALVDAWCEAFEPNVDLLDALEEVPCRRALLTNNGPMLDLCLDGPLAHLAAKFDVRICSWHLAAKKPAPKAFERAAFRLASTPACLLLVDDSPTNTRAAQQAGWRAVTHSSNADTLDRLRRMLC
jgi:glucose-1-phosphatase